MPNNEIMTLRKSERFLELQGGGELAIVRIWPKVALSVIPYQSVLLPDQRILYVT